MSGTNLNCSAHNFINKNCFELSEPHYVIIFWTKTVVLILAAVACSLAIGMMVFFKAYKNFFRRLALYLAIAALFNCFAFILNSLPVENRCGYMLVKNEGFCVASGFLDQYTTCVILLLVCWITLHTFLLGVLKINNNSLRCEVAGVMIVLVASLGSSSIPFIDFGNGTMYGLTGAWCWIRTTDENCIEFTEGVVEQYVFWYGTVMFFVIFNFLAAVAVNIAVYRGKQQAEGHLRRRYKDALRETMPLLFYPIIFSIIYSLAFFNRAYYAGTRKTVVALWAIAESNLPLFIPLAFLLHPSTLKSLNRCSQALNKWRHQSEYTETHFVVSREGIGDDEEEEILIR